LDGRFDGNAAKMVQAWVDGRRYDGNAPEIFQAWLDGKYDTKAACAGRSKHGGQSHADVEAACEREYLNMCHERQTQCTLDPEIHSVIEKLRSEEGLTPAKADFLDDVESGLAEIQDIFWEAASVRALRRDDVERVGCRWQS
jgi:hypothetical protein